MAEETTNDDNSVVTNIRATNEIKIVDLNNNMPNFEATFTAKSTSQTPFKIIAINDKTLDDKEPDEKDYKIANEGVISGQIFSDVDTPDSFSLIVKSHDNKESDVEISITRREIPAWSRSKKPLSPEEKTLLDNRNKKQTEPTPAKTKPPPKPETEKSKKIENYKHSAPEKTSYFSRKNIFIGLIILILFCLVIYFCYSYFYKSKTSSSPTPTPIPTPTPQNDIPEPNTIDTSLLNDLKEL